MRGTPAAVVAAVTALIAGSALAQASPTAAVDGGDSFNVAAGTAVSATTAMVTIAVASVPAMVITCTASTFSGRTGSTLTFALDMRTLSNAGGQPCTDSLGFTDSFSSNTTNGAWTVKEKDFSNAGAGDEGRPEPNATGDKLSINLPKAGLIDTNNWPCSITFAPSGAVAVAGAYNDGGTFKIAGAKIPVSVAGPSFCGAASQTVTLTATYTVGPAIFDQG